jgi:hypothetical protein
MKPTMIALVLLATAACSAYHFPGNPTAGTGTVSGQVIVVPCGALESADQPCAAKPFSGLELDFTKGTTTVAATTGPGGNYSVELAEGRWTVSAKQIMRIVKGPGTITVHAGDRIVANFVVDSGIRVPIAAA